MRHINLIEETSGIQSLHHLKAFNLKVDHLVKQLSYLDRVGIPATVILNPREQNGEVITEVTIRCGDIGFKEVIAKLLDKFRHVAVLVTAGNNEDHHLGGLH